jgi:hypothetical protein
MSANVTRKLFRTTLNGVLVLFSTVACIYAIEGICLFFVPGFPERALHGFSMQERQYHRWSRLYGGGPAAGLNSWGQRDVERTVEKRGQGTRVAFIGDSFLECGETPLSIVTERKLARDAYEILSLGVSGSAPDDYYFRLKNVALRLDVDHVVMFFYAGNDFIQRPSLKSFYGGLSAVYPRDSLLSNVGLSGLNHLFTNRHRPIYRLWVVHDLIAQEQKLHQKILALEGKSTESLPGPQGGWKQFPIH